VRDLIRQISMENPLWGAPRIHGELLKLGFEVAQSSVAKYMVKPLDKDAPVSRPVQRIGSIKSHAILGRWTETPWYGVGNPFGF
jgi:hypothetical protein